MAKTRATTRSAAKKPGKKAPAKKQARPKDDAPKSVRYTPTRARVVLEQLSARYPALGAQEEIAFLGLATEMQCAQHGGKTRSQGVLDEGVRWAVTMDQALRAHPDVLRGYRPKRFAFFLRRLGVLADSIAAHEGRRGRKGAAQGTAASAWDAATASRAGLVSKLRTFAGMRETEVAAIAEAAGSADKEDKLARSLTSLAELAASWLKRGDDISRILAENADLSHADVVDARGRAEDLVQASAQEKLEPSAGQFDPPAVNIAEGRVLLEMREARRLFGEANQKNRQVPKLVPGPATRHVLGRRASGRGEEDEPPPAGAGSEGAAPAPA